MSPLKVQKPVLFALALASLTLSYTAGAVEVRSCKDAGIDITALVPPPVGTTRSFANGRIVIYTVDTEEPAACSAGLAIVMPDIESEWGGAKCVAINGTLSAVHLEQ